MMNPGDSNFVSEFSMESGGNVVSDDAPFHVLVLGDWRGAVERSGGIDSRKPFEIDRDEFDDVMRRLRPRAELFFGDANVLTIEFNEIDDFHPDRLFGRLSVFESLRQVREELRDPRSFDHAAREVRSWFSAEAEVVAAEQVEKKTIEEEDLLDAILSGKSVDAGDVKRRPKGPADLRDFISDIVAPHIVKTDLAEQAKLLAVVDEVTSDLMRQILHHPDFQSLESAWRGLHFLVMRTDTSSDLRIFLMDVTKPELEEDLKSASDLSQSVYCQWVAGERATDLTGHPWAVVCGNYNFEPVVEDIAALMRISQVGVAANTTFLSAMSSRVLGIDKFSDQPEPSMWRSDVDSAEAKLWSALRSTRESEFLGLGSLRMLVRAPYGIDSDATETFVFEEMDGRNRHEDYLWINPAFACASVLTRNFRNNGWAIAAGMNRDIEGLPMHVFRVDGEKVTKPCAEIPMTESGVERIVAAGLIPLVSFRDSDRVRVASFQSVAESEERIRGRWY